MENKFIIVCDDLPSHQIAVARGLRKLGFEPIRASYPLHAIRSANEFSPVAILMDHIFDNYATSSIPSEQQITGMDCGIYLHLALNIPIIFFTAYDEVIKRHPIARVILDRYGSFSKTPLDLPSLGSSIRQATEAHSAWNATNGFFSVDKNLKVTSANEAARSIFAGNILGSNVVSIFSDNTVRALEQIAFQSGSVRVAPTPCSLSLAFLGNQCRSVGATVTPVWLFGSLAALRCEWAV